MPLKTQPTQPTEKFIEFKSNVNSLGQQEARFAEDRALTPVCEKSAIRAHTNFTQWQEPFYIGTF